MSPIDFIEHQIIDLCTRAGVRLDIAKAQAGIAKYRYEQNRFENAADLVHEAVVAAKKANVK
jgi:hypothetical protein